MKRLDFSSSLCRFKKDSLVSSKKSADIGVPLSSYYSRRRDHIPPCIIDSECLASPTRE